MGHGGPTYLHQASASCFLWGCDSIGGSLWYGESGGGVAEESEGEDGGELHVRGWLEVLGVASCLEVKKDEGEEKGGLTRGFGQNI